jgi:hypothetical protein
MPTYLAGERIERGDAVVVKDGIAYRAHKTPRDEFIAEANRLMSDRGYELVAKRGPMNQDAIILEYRHPTAPSCTVGASGNELAMNSIEGVINLAASRVLNSLALARDV